MRPSTQACICFCLLWMAAFQASATPDRQANLTQGTNLAVTTTQENHMQILALHGAIYQKHPDRPVTKALLDVSMDAWEPHVSKDGQKLVFQSFRNGSFDLYEIELGEREPTPEALTLSPFDDREPHYSPDGDQILFSSDRSASYEIWLLDADSKVVEQLTKTSGEANSPA